MPGTAAGTVFRQALRRHLGHFLAAGLIRALLARDHHVRLQDRPFQDHALIKQLGVEPLEGELGHFITALDGVIAIHQNLGLDDGDDIGFLAQRRVAGQRVHVHIHGVLGGNVLAIDVDDGAPFGEARAQIMILGQTLAQTIEALGDGLAFGARQRLGARRRP
jgi:hypothetical protein